MKSTDKIKRGFTQVGLPDAHHQSLQRIADSEGGTRCGVIKRAITPLIMAEIAEQTRAKSGKGFRK